MFAWMVGDDLYTLKSCIIKFLFGNLGVVPRETAVNVSNILSVVKSMNE